MLVESTLFVTKESKIRKTRAAFSINENVWLWKTVRQSKKVKREAGGNPNYTFQIPMDNSVFMQIIEASDSDEHDSDRRTVTELTLHMDSHPL